MRTATNALDKWIAASSRSLTSFVRQEMAAYRLYTVVPRLVRFIGDLTNVYVRYNRKRLKGGKSQQDCLLALTSLYEVLLTLCKASLPDFRSRFRGLALLTFPKYMPC